jgi:hypothetical protein
MSGKNLEQRLNVKFCVKIGLEQRLNVKFCVKIGKSASETLALLTVAYC